MIEKIKLKFSELKKTISETFIQLWENHKDKFFIFLLGCGMALTMILIVLSLTGCMMSKPKESDLPKEISKIEKRDILKYYNCLYAQQFIKTIDLKCGELQNSMSKNSLIIDYSDLKELKKLPLLYNQKGENEMTFDEYFKYVK